MSYNESVRSSWQTYFNSEIISLNPGIALKKYGPREDEREKSLTELFENLKTNIKNSPLTITTDAHPLYRKLIRKYFPSAKHIQVISRDHLKKKRELV